jgi:hypothetical protein
VNGRVHCPKTDHCSLKHLLDQRLSTVPQHTWVSKLFGYIFTVEYKPGKQNAAATLCHDETRTSRAFVPKCKLCLGPSSRSLRFFARRPLLYLRSSPSVKRSAMALLVLAGLK